MASRLAFSITRHEEQKTMNAYTISTYLTHIEQALAEWLEWHDGQFKTPRERDAYKAGFTQGQQAAKGLISLHAGLNLSDPTRSKRQ